MFVGYNKQFKAYRFLDIATNMVTISGDVVVDETQELLSTKQI
jgi:hypothetical protein